MPTREELAIAERFRVGYGIDAAAAVDLERFVLGSDYGASGYTTMAQADLLADLLHLGAGDRLLDIGSGRGWPGLHLGVRSGCTVVVTDLNHGGMTGAQRRIRRDGLSASFAVISAARRLPFGPRSFDAVIHADTLC